jgi:hypothetical protein
MAHLAKKKFVDKKKKALILLKVGKSVILW